MASKRITYGDIYQLLEAEGFRPTAEKGDHVRYDNPAKEAALILPKKRSALGATGMNVALVRRTMVDFGVMSEADFLRWLANPKHFQAA